MIYNMYIYIYIYRERERELSLSRTGRLSSGVRCAPNLPTKLVPTYTYMCIYIYIMCIYIYI